MIACVCDQLITQLDVSSMEALHVDSLWLAGTHLHLGLCVTLRVQVSHNAVDAERPSEAQQVGHVPEGAAEQDGTAKGAIHGAPDRWGASGVLDGLRGWRARSWMCVREHIRHHFAC